jgi:hypothetical protein
MNFSSCLLHDQANVDNPKKNELCANVTCSAG